MKRILFIPSDHGGGRGHVSRALYLAQQAHTQGYQTGVVLERKHFKSANSPGIQRFLMDTRLERVQKYQFKKPFKPGVRLKTKVFTRPVFVEFGGLAWQVPRDGLWTEKLVRLRLKQLSRIVESFKPDILVGDTHFHTRLLGGKYQIPVIQITRYQGWPPQPDFLWWQTQCSFLRAPDALEPFKPMLNEQGLQTVPRIEDLLAGERYLIPSIPEMEPVDKKQADLVYCGVLSDIKSVQKQTIFNGPESNIPKIYITIGGGAERGQLNTFFKKIVSVFNQTDYRVLISTGRRVQAKQFNNCSANVKVVDWVDGVTAIQQADLVIHHGGYATTMETLLAKKPALVIPSHSEQEGNGRRLETLGLGKVILPFKEKLQPLEFEWPYGLYSMGAAFQMELNADEIHEAINRLLYGETYQKLEKISASLQHLRTRFNLEKILNI